MPIPKYDEMMLPYLHAIAHGDAHKHRDIAEIVADHFQLSEDNRNALLPSGNQTFLLNRVSWARTYLKKAGLLKSPARGWVQITPTGLQVLEMNPPHIDKKFLMQFESFQEFQNRSQSSQTNGGSETQTAQQDTEELTPEEVIASGHQQLRQQIASDLLERIRENTPRFFELLVIDLLLAMGYGGSRQDAGRAVGRSGDGGIDGIIKEDRLGLNNIYVQAKRWENTVGRPEVQAFSGALDMHRANRGVFITTSHFSAEARDFVERIGKKIVLIDGDELAELLIDYTVGVTTKAVYAIHEVDENYFDDE